MCVRFLKGYIKVNTPTLGQTIYPVGCIYAVLFPNTKASLNHLSFNKRMRNHLFSLLLFSSVLATAQTQQNIHKNTGTVSTIITTIDSIRFTGSFTIMEVILQDGTVASHAISDIINVNCILRSK